MSSKYDHIDFTPPKAVSKAAKKGLEYRSRQGDKAGLTPSEASKEGIGSGVQRAVNLKNRDSISPKVIRQMDRFFSRHEKNKSINPEFKGEPWKDKGYVSWLLWGGDPGQSWVKKIIRQMDAADASTVTARCTIQFDTAVAHRASDQLVSSALNLFKRYSSVFEEDKPLSNATVREALGSTKIQLKNVQGKDVSVKLELRHRPGKGFWTTGGHYADNGVITVYLNSSRTPTEIEFAKNDVESAVASILVHEITHVLDVIPKKYVNVREDQSAYYNQPSEFRAFAKQMLEGARRTFQKLKRTKYRRGLPPKSKLLEEILDNSSAYRLHGKHLTPKNQNRLRLMLVNELEDLMKDSYDTVTASHVVSQFLRNFLKAAPKIISTMNTFPRRSKFAVISGSLNPDTLSRTKPTLSLKDAAAGAGLVEPGTKGTKGRIPQIELVPVLNDTADMIDAKKKTKSKTASVVLAKYLGNR